MSAPVYLSRRWVDTDEWSMDVTVDPDFATITLPAGFYFLDADLTSQSLVKTLDNELEVAFPAHNFTCTFDMVTGLITFTCPTLAGADWEMSFNEPAFARWIGFGITGGWAGSPTETHTGENVCQGVIYALSNRSKYKGRPRVYGARQRSSQAGDMASTSHGGVIITTGWTHENELERFQASPLASGTWDESLGEAWDEINETDPWCWQDFFDHHFGGAQCGQPVRVYPTPQTAIDEYEDTYQVKGGQSFAPGLVEDESTYWWVVELSLQVEPD